MSAPESFEHDRKDINTRALIRQVEAEVRTINTSIARLVEVIEKLKEEVGQTDVEVQLAHGALQHVVSNGKLIVYLGVCAATIIGGAWAVMQSTRSEISAALISQKTDVSARVNAAEQRVDTIQRLMFEQAQKKAANRR